MNNVFTATVAVKETNQEGKNTDDKQLLDNDCQVINPAAEEIQNCEVQKLLQ